MSGGLGYRVLATMLFLMIFAMAEITKTTHRIVLEALQGKYEETKLSVKFERMARFDSLLGVAHSMAVQLRLRDMFDGRGYDKYALTVFWMDSDCFCG